MMITSLIYCARTRTCRVRRGSDAGRTWWPMAVAALALFAAGVALMRPDSIEIGRPIRFMIPSGFRGLFKIVRDESGSDAALSSGTYVVKVPQQGVLRYRSFKPFSDLHETSARFEDGTELPVDIGLGSYRPSDEVVVWDLGTISKSWFFGRRFIALGSRR